MSSSPELKFPPCFKLNPADGHVHLPTASGNNQHQVGARREERKKEWGSPQLGKRTAGIHQSQKSSTRKTVDALVETQCDNVCYI